MIRQELASVAKSLVAPGKGILAADASTETMNKRLEAVGAEPSEEMRRRWREVLLTTAGMEQFISGVILFDETIRQKTQDGVWFRDILRQKHVLAGIKVDQGAKDSPEFPGEKVTQGLDGLEGRCEEYMRLGAEFAKWRAVITIGQGLPTLGAIEANALALAVFAAVAQAQGLVPIVEPEVLLDGDHTIERCAEVTERVLQVVFEKLESKGVDLAGMLLKPNMVMAGKNCSTQARATEVAEKTVATLKAVVPKEVPGIVFLSGGQTPEQATENLNAIIQLDRQPWELSFSFERALENEALGVWQGKEENVTKAQEMFLKRAERVARAREGKLL